MSNKLPSPYEVLITKIEFYAKMASDWPDYERELKLLCDILSESHIPKQAISLVLKKLGHLHTSYKEKLQHNSIHELIMELIMEVIINIETRKKI